MKHRVAVAHGRILHVLDVAFVLKVGIGERELARTVRFRQHALELDLGQAPLGPLAAQRAPDAADVGLAVAAPALRLARRQPPHLGREARKIARALDWSEYSRRCGSRGFLSNTTVSPSPLCGGGGKPDLRCPPIPRTLSLP